MIRDLIFSAQEGDKWWLAGGIHPSQVVAAYQPKGAASLEASYVNLANPGTYDAAVGVAPTLDTSGWVFAGAQHLNTGVIPSANTFFMFVRFSCDVGSYFIAAGARGTTTTLRFEIAPAFYANHGYALGGLISVVGQTPSGVMALANNNGYLNGAYEVSGSFTGNDRPIYIGGTNNVGSIDFKYTGKIHALLLGNGSLSAAQIAALSATMAAL
jgi:hypothetical protein